jgi:hypothetical protein
MFRYGTASAQARTVVLIASIAISALIALTACGSATVGGAGQTASGVGQSTTPAATVSAAAGAPLCAATQKVDRVVVSRASAVTASPREILPRGITVRGATQVRALAAALCSLPPMPAGLSCPADFGGVVQLVFAAGGRGFQPVHIQDSGCHGVTGIGPTRWWSRSPQFGRMLSEAVGGTGKLVPGTHPSSVPTGP